MGTSACRDAGLSNGKRAQAVSTTAVANAEEKSTLGADAMHATMPLKKASFPGRGRWDATPCGRDEAKGAAVAPAAADSTDWARACGALLATMDASRAAVFACSISSSNRPTSACYRLFVIVKRPLGPRRRACQVQGSVMGAPVPEALGGALCRARRAQMAAVVPFRARGGQLVALSRGWRELASRRPRVRWGLVWLRLSANRRVDTLNWWERVKIWCSVSCLVTGTHVRWLPQSRVAGSRASSPCLVGIQVGVR